MSLIWSPLASLGSDDIVPAIKHYVLLGNPKRRRWEDARRFGFVSGGGGPKWTRRLRELLPGDRVYVHVPVAGPHGYVWIGEVAEAAVPAEDFLVNGSSILDRPDLVS